MSNNTSVVETINHKFNGFLVEERIYRSGETRFFIVAPGQRAKALPKARYFELMEKKAADETARFKARQELNKKDYSGGSRVERTKVDWYWYNEENAMADEWFSAFVDKHHPDFFPLSSFVDEENDFVNTGGWIVSINGNYRFVSRHLFKGSPSILDERDRIFKKLKLVDVDVIRNQGVFIEAEFYTPPLTDEQAEQVLLGLRGKDDFALKVEVYEYEVLPGLVGLYKVIYDADNIGCRVWYVVDPQAVDSDEDDIEEEA